ncbi:hypothetical protein CUC08_Gglean006594 [Alternaria sp. MG1]|nr:hypothetical protein CUC08_Gglean006594 [Alternaria sp. MG1]
MGWTYNTPDDAANDGPHITAVAIIFTALSLSILSLRFYVRGWMIKAIGADDWILIATWVSSYTLCCSIGTDNLTDSVLRLRGCDYRPYVD